MTDSVDNCNQITLSVIIVNYNGATFLSNCLSSLKNHLPLSHEIILVDNASCDESVKIVSERYPWVKLITSEKNLGFTGGNNLGVRTARGRFILLLNNDTVVMKSLLPLVKILEEDENIGALGCQLFYEDNSQQKSIGYIPSLSKIILSWSFLPLLMPWFKPCQRTVPAKSSLYLKSLVNVEMVSGAFIMTPKALWNRLGGLDENYFMYMEDVDYCRRVRSVGFRVVYSSLACVTHYEGGGRSWIGANAILNSTKSYLIYVGKYNGDGWVIFLCCFLSQIFFARAVAYWICGAVKIDQDGFDKALAFRKAGFELIAAIVIYFKKICKNIIYNKNSFEIN